MSKRVLPKIIVTNSGTSKKIKVDRSDSCFINRNKCFHCKKSFIANEFIVTIEMNQVSAVGRYPKLVVEYDELHFHRECFLEIAGKEYMPLCRFQFKDKEK